MRPTGPVMLAPLSLLTLESVCSRRSRFRTLLERERRPELELDLDSEFLILSHVLVEPPSRFDRDESFDSVRSVSWKPLCLRDKTSSRGDTTEGRVAPANGDIDEPLLTRTWERARLEAGDGGLGKLVSKSCEVSDPIP